MDLWMGLFFTKKKSTLKKKLSPKNQGKNPNSKV